MPFVSNYVLNDRGNFNLQLLRRFKDIAVIVVGSYISHFNRGLPKEAQAWGRNPYIGPNHHFYALTLLTMCVFGKH